MRWMLCMISCAVSFAVLVPPATSPVMAADLSLTPRKVVRVHHRAVLRVVRDYDGTPVVLRRRLDGTDDAYFAERASPTRYLNGQRVTFYR